MLLKIKDGIHPTLHLALRQHIETTTLSILIQQRHYPGRACEGGRWGLHLDSQQKMFGALAPALSWWLDRENDPKQELEESIGPLV